MPDESLIEKGFFPWVAKCCEIAGWSLEDGRYLMPEYDPSWFFCFDDGMAPEQAVEEYRSKVSV